MAGNRVGHFIILGLMAGVAGGWLAACTPGTSADGPVTADGQPIVDATVNAPTSVKLIDRDVEAPDVFQTESQALWDGRPSLGGVWVASPDAKDPERVIMRNPANGKFVIGALFRRERDNPGPKLQISSDAADALGMLAGEPGKISVTALRREETAPTPDAKAPILDSAEAVGTTPLPDVTATAAQAIDAADAKSKMTGPATTPPTLMPVPKTDAKAAATASAKPAPAPAPATTAAAAPATAATATTNAPAATTAATPPAVISTAPAKSAATGPLIQIGIFSVEANAQRAVDALTKAGISATIRPGEAQGKSYWSVTARGGAATLAKIKAAGFADAYLLKK